jgi:hypothetical protein
LQQLRYTAQKKKQKKKKKKKEEEATAAEAEQGVDRQTELIELHSRDTHYPQRIPFFLSFISLLLLLLLLSFSLFGFSCSFVSFLVHRT